MREVRDLEYRCDEFQKFDITDVSTVTSMVGKILKYSILTLYR